VKKQMTYSYTVGRILDHFPDVTPANVLRQLRRTTFVSLEKRYFYFAVPKAACTQMKEILRTVEKAPPIQVFADGSPQTRRDMFIHARPNVPLPSLVDLDDRTQKEVLEAPDFLRMTVVRNPYTRLVSAWTNKVVLCEPGVREEYLEIKGRLPDLQRKVLISFPEFVGYVADRCDLRICNNHWRRQVDHTFFPAMNFSLVVKIEQLEEGLRQFEQHLGSWHSFIADGRNKSISSKPGLYTRDLADKVYSLYRADFEVLGYNRNTWEAGNETRTGEPRKGYVSEERFRDEIIERNLIISSLYEERDRLRAELQWISRLHLQPAIKGIVTLHSISQKIARKIKGSTFRLLRPRRQMQKAILP
jgi:hypothetical protein